MKIIFCLNNDIYALYALNLLFDDLKKHKIKIILSKSVGNITKIPQKLQKLVEFEQEKLINLDLSNFTKNTKKLLNFIEISNFFAEKLEFCENINSAESAQKISNFAPDLIVSLRFGQIFHENIIKIPKKAIINLHSGILPQYRGIMASFWSILEKNPEIGTSLHFINDRQIDKGDVIRISKQKTDFKGSYFSNLLSLYNQGCRDILWAINIIDNGDKNDFSKILSADEGGYFSYPNDAQIDSFCKKMSLF